MLYLICKSKNAYKKRFYVLYNLIKKLLIVKLNFTISKTGFSTGFPVESVENSVIFSSIRVKLLKKRWKKLKTAWLRRLKSTLIVENSVEIWESFRSAVLGVLTVFVK